MEDFTFDDGDDEEPKGQDYSAEGDRPATLQRGKSGLKAILLHSVSEEMHTSTLKLFNWRDTGTGLLERTLVSPDRAAREAVYRGFTCRAAKWDPLQGCYTFNGRSGASIDEPGELPPCIFFQLIGQLQPADGTDKAIQDQGLADVQQLKFVGGAPRVDQFLDGMYKTELVDPEAARDPSEVPTDAQKYNATPHYQTRQYGRSRRPATMEPAFDTDYDVSEDEFGHGEADESSSSEDDTSEKAAVLKKFRNTTVAQPIPDIAQRDTATPGATLSFSGAGAQTPEPGSVACMSQPSAQNLTA